MGIGLNSSLKSLLYFKNNNPDSFTGAMLTLGRQDVYFSYDDLIETSARFSIVLKPVTPQYIENKWINKIVIDDFTLFSSLGFSSIDSMDYVDNEGANIIHDLNKCVPDELAGRWDFVLDSGTIEHVFDLKTAFHNVDLMLKPNGIVAHFLPLNNWIDHGFWQICPTALVDFYGANGYKILNVWAEVFEAGKDLHTAEPSRYLYDPTLFQNVCYLDKFPNGKVGLYFFAQKKSTQLQTATPTQGFYQKHWGGSDGALSNDHSFGVTGGPLNIKSIIEVCLPDNSEIIEQNNCSADIDNAASITERTTSEKFKLLRELGDLRLREILNEEEFEIEKKKLLT